MAPSTDSLQGSTFKGPPPQVTRLPAAASIAVIGAGAAGLVAARFMRDAGFRVTVFETTNQVGGTWVYQDRPQVQPQNQQHDPQGRKTSHSSHHQDAADPDRTHRYFESSMYKNLHTNLPVQVMQFHDYPFPKSVPSFPSHTIIMDYLVNYGIDHHLVDLIRFNTSVIKVDRIQECPMSYTDPVQHPPQNIGASSNVPTVNTSSAFTTPDRWNVISQSSSSHYSSPIREVYDAVVVCNGHYTKPKIPSLPGLDNFPGKIMHSHDYKNPSPFQGLNVVLLGAGNSGIDIAIELAQVANSVFLSCRDGPSYPYSKPSSTNDIQPLLNTARAHLKPTDHGVIRIACATHLNPDASVTLDDGSRIPNVHVFMFCTGYHYDFPFLADSCQVQVDQNMVAPLYKHLIHIHYPTLSFVGLPWKVVPFPLFEYQVAYLVALYTGRATLPHTQILQDIWQQENNDRQTRSIPKHYAHLLADAQWEYNRQLCGLAAAASIVPIQPPVIKAIYDDCSRAKRVDPKEYRNRNYIVTGQGELDWICLVNGEDVTPY